MFSAYQIVNHASGKAYYSENDPFAAAWLRELIKAGLIASGEVDERSIEDVQPEDVRGFTQCHFFAGIGAWSYALRLAGWSDDRPIWSGSCPCPSFSAAGKGDGFEDARHLWPSWFELIRKCRPATIFGEQVEAAIGFGWIDLVQTDMEAEAYAFGKAVLGACSVGAPHRRQRVYFVADSQVKRTSGMSEAGQSYVERISATFSGSNSERPGNRSAPQRSDHESSQDERSADRVSRRGGAPLSGSEPLHAKRRSLHEHGEDGRNGQDGGRAEAHGIAGARGEVCERPNAEHNGHDSAGRIATLANCNQSGIGLPDGDGVARNGSNASQRGLGKHGSTSGDSRHSAPSNEVGDGIHADSPRSQPGRITGQTAGHGSPVEPTGGTVNGTDSEHSRREKRHPKGEGPEAALPRSEIIREWRGLGWLDPVAARSASEAGATRGFWADCDWWYGRDEKHRPIGPGISPLVAGTTQSRLLALASGATDYLGLLRDLGETEIESGEARTQRLRGYGNAICAEVAQAFIEAYMSLLL